MRDPLIIVEHHPLRQRGLATYFAWLGVPAVSWLGAGPAPQGSAAIACVADVRPDSKDRIDLRGLHAVLRLRHEQPELPIVAYSAVPDGRLGELERLLAARRIRFLGLLNHLDDLTAELGLAPPLAG